VAQFAPAMIGGMYWRGGTRGGALAGLSAGFLVWGYTLLLPSFAKSGWLPDGFLTQGLFGIELLRPQQLFGLTGIRRDFALPVLEFSRQYWRLCRRFAVAAAGWWPRRRRRRCSSTHSRKAVRSVRCSGEGARRSAICRNWSAVFSARRRRSWPLPAMPAATA
jgi:hypothetical protein